MAFSLETDEIQDLRDSIDVLESAANTPARSRTTKVGPVVDEICQYAYQFGLQDAELQRLVTLVTSKTELDQNNLTTLVTNLYPANRVSIEILTRLINCFGQAKTKPAPAIQVALVRWIIAVHDVLEDPSYLSCFYSVMFHLLDMISLRPALCQLLSLITRRKHVRPFRIQRLLELAQRTAGESALLNLLRVYKNYCPEIIIGATAAKLPQSMLPDPEWRQRLRAIQQNAAITASGSGDQGGFRVTRDDHSRGRESVLPPVQTFHATEATKTLEDVQTAVDFVEHLEHLEAPSQIASALRDPLLQKFLQLRGLGDAEQRLEFWLSSYLDAELEILRDGFGLSATLSELLTALVSFTDTSKALPFVAERFLRAYLPLWNGSSDSGAILDLLAFLPPQPFQKLHQDILSTLESSVFCGAEAPFDVLFSFYGSLTMRWMGTYSTASDQTPRGFLKSNAIFSLIEHVAVLAESALAAGKPAHAAILSFYERTTDLVMEQINVKKQIIPAILPPRTLAYSLAITTSLSDYSRLCALLVTYKRCFEKQEAGVTRVYQSNATDLLNGYLMDVCNLVWRSRALNTTDPNATGLMCPELVTAGLQSYLSKVERDYSVHTMFDFSHGHLLAAMTKTAFIELEEKAQGMTSEELPSHAGPVTQRSLVLLEKEGGITLTWKQYRLEMLNWLDRYGFDGLRRLMFATMKDLMK